MLRSVAYALRQLRRSPGFASAAILTLALGIGANTAIYQVLDAVAFRSLPIREPHRLFLVRLLENGKPQNFSYSAYRELAARQQVAAGMLAVSDYPLHAAILRGRGPARIINAVLATGNYFQVLGVDARRGRVFTETDDQVAVISDAFWEREFRRDPAAIGQPLAINKAVVTIIGVAPPGFSGEAQGNSPDVWLPMAVAPHAMATDWRNAPNAFWLTVLARLDSEISPHQAQAALSALYANLRHDPGDFRLELLPASRGIAELQQRFESPLLVLMAVVGTVLLIACCNLANLLLGRAAARTHEIGVRLALGAGRARLIRQLLIESLVLSAIGAAVALALARWGARALVALAGVSLPLDLGWRVIGFTAVVTIAAACLFGLAPALAATRVDLLTALQAGRRSQTAGHRHILGKALIVAQISLALILLSGASLLARSFWNLRHQDFGFRASNVLMAELPWEFSPSMMARYAALTQPLYDQLNALPDVRSAALSCFGPMGADQHTGAMSTPGVPATGVRIAHVSPRYFETMGIPIVAGRGITADDRAGSPKIAVLSESTARRLFGAADPVGCLVTPGKRFDASDVWRVAGVAHDVRFAGPSDPFGFVVYVPVSQAPAPITAVLLRTSGDPAHAASAVRTILHTLDPDMAVGAIRTLPDVIDAHLTQERLMAGLAAAFGLLALSLTCVGIYGVISYAVARRTREIGIRLALGANRRHVGRVLMKDVALLVACGAAPGLAGSFALTRAMRTIAFGFATDDYAILAAVALVLMLTAAAAGFLPAQRAARLDPMDALRQE